MSDIKVTMPELTEQEKRDRILKVEVEIRLTTDEREQYRNYARAVGWKEENVLAASDERLMNLMHSFADECAKYGCD